MYYLVVPNEMYESPYLSVIIPCFNEEKTILELLGAVAAQSVVKEIIIIDDKSTDTSLKLINDFESDKIKVIENPKNMGKGYSIQQGLKYVTAPILIIQDADLEYSPTEYGKLAVPIIEGRADVVYGSRYLPSNEKAVLYFWHKLGNNFLTFISNLFSNLALTDMETCYKMIRTDFAKVLQIKENRFGIEPEITAKLASTKARFYEVSISYHGRSYESGKKITWKDGFSALFCIVKYNTPWEKIKYKKKSLTFLQK